MSRGFGSPPFESPGVNYLRHCLLVGLFLFCWVPAQALVDPEVEAWQKLVNDTNAALEIPGSEILGVALAEFGDLGSALAKAPLEDLMIELEQRRGLNFKYFTPWHTKNKEELRVFIKEQLAKEYTPDKVEQDEAMLKALGLISPDFKIVPFLEDLYTDQIAGAYDPATDQFFLVDMTSNQSLTKRMATKATKLASASAGISLDMTSVIIIHELDHALGGQHFPLKKVFDKLLKEWSLDRQMAAAALVEGDATFVMMDHQRRTPAKDQGESTVILGMAEMTQMLGALADFNLPGLGLQGFADAPLFFQKSLIFPYYSGAEFVSTLRHSPRKWKMVDKAYKLETMPTSTEQIYHPYRYPYRVRKPKNPDFTKLPDSLGPWKKVTDNTGGEFLLRIVLEQHETPAFQVAADGWNGDRLRVYRHSKDGRLAFLWLIRWDDGREAQQFHRMAWSLPFQRGVAGDLTALSSGFDGKELAKLRTALGPNP